MYLTIIFLKIINISKQWLIKDVILILKYLFWLVFCQFGQFLINHFWISKPWPASLTPLIH